MIILNYHEPEKKKHFKVFLHLYYCAREKIGHLHGH